MQSRLALAVAVHLSVLTLIVADGTYSLDMSGAQRAHVGGRATAAPSAFPSDADPSFSIVLHLPKGTAPGDPSGEEFLAFATDSRARPGSGQYRLVTPDVHMTGKSLGAVLSGDDRNPWECVDGSLELTSARSANTELHGTFSIRFARNKDPSDRDGPRDTLRIAGRFDIPDHRAQ